MITNPHMLTKVICEDMMQIIGGKENGQIVAAPYPCALRIASFVGKPCASADTVVGCHLPIFGKGTATKVTVVAVAAGCSTCHDMLDDRSELGRVARDRYPAAFYEQLMRANHETIARWIEGGWIQIPRGKMV